MIDSLVICFMVYVQKLFGFFRQYHGGYQILKLWSQNHCLLDAVGSWQIILPMPNLERAY